METEVVFHNIYCKSRRKVLEKTWKFTANYLYSLEAVSTLKAIDSCPLHLVIALKVCPFFVSISYKLRWRETRDI